MTLQELGSLGEFIGSVGVIVTLIYLAIQLRQNTHAMEESQRIARVDAMTQRMDIMDRTHVQAAINPEILEIRLRALEEGVENLSRLEFARLRSWETARAMRAESQFFQWQNGMLDDEYYQQFELLIQNSAPLWTALGMTYGRPSFREAVERIVAGNRQIT